ncbi:hypothetical protein OL548_22690 [Lysinibacillus sp. MHQ-1]|nr:hypothetical protein OL548_22690 [Lysinibacillus sp. MHQ-1]
MLDKVAQEKSTLGRIILGMERPTAGEVLFQGVNLYDATSQQKKNDTERFTSSLPK